MLSKELKNRFTYHAPKDDQFGRFGEIRAMAEDFADELNLLVPDSREKSLAITKLEEVVMWANAGIARNE